MLGETTDTELVSEAEGERGRSSCHAGELSVSLAVSPVASHEGFSIPRLACIVVSNSSLPASDVESLQFDELVAGDATSHISDVDGMKTRPLRLDGCRAMAIRLGGLGGSSRKQGDGESGRLALPAPRSVRLPEAASSWESMAACESLSSELQENLERVFG